MSNKIEFAPIDKVWLVSSWDFSNANGCDAYMRYHLSDLNKRRKVRPMLRVLLAITVLLFVASSALADKAAERQRGLNRTLIIVKKADLEAANKAAAIAFGPSNAKMFSQGYGADLKKEPTHYVASVMLSARDKAKFDKAFADLVKAKKIDTAKVSTTTVATKLKELKLEKADATAAPDGKESKEPDEKSK